MYVYVSAQAAESRGKPRANTPPAKEWPEGTGGCFTQLRLRPKCGLSSEGSPRRRRIIPWVCHRAGRRVLCYQEAWRKAVHDAGLSGLRFYDVRHVAASEMLAAGADLPAVSAQLGHSSTHTTATTYAHAVPGAQQRAADLVPSLLPHRKK